jgi:class 3 adenylate cyclase
MDIVASSKLSSDEQRRIVERLQEIVRQSHEYQRSQALEKVITLPTGDGMALAFFDKLDAAALCAIEVAKGIQSEQLCQVRMGIHLGSVFVMNDINNKRNISGAGINLAERVMSCGGAGHILLSDNVGELLRHLGKWSDKIQEVGECQVKDGWIRVWNLVDGPIGNASPPKTFKRHIRFKPIFALMLVLMAALFSVAFAAVAWIHFREVAPESRLMTLALRNVTLTSCRRRTLRSLQPAARSERLSSRPTAAPYSCGTACVT